MLVPNSEVFIVLDIEVLKISRAVIAMGHCIAEFSAIEDARRYRKIQQQFQVLAWIVQLDVR